MANQNNSQELKGWDKVVAWYARHSYAVNMIYSLGASVVIIGALFKILHWPGASYVLMVGMFTEAFLFMLGIFEKPHASYHWENVFPQLVGNKVEAIHGGAAVVGSGASQGSAALPEAQMLALKEGIENLNKTAKQLASLGDISDATAQLKANVLAAGQAVEGAATSIAQNGANIGTQYGQLAQAYQSIIAEINNIVAGTKTYGQGVEGVNAQMSSLNSVYELQLKALQAQAQALNAQTEKLNGATSSFEAIVQNAQQMQQSANQAAQAAQQYQTAQQQLAQQVTDLNKVYGNMLNALA